MPWMTVEIGRGPPVKVHSHFEFLFQRRFSLMQISLREEKYPINLLAAIV